MIKHIVLLKIKKRTPARAIQKIRRDLAALQKKIPGIVDFAWGPYSSREGLNQGFTHGFIITFKDARSRDRYLPHPEHEIVKALVIKHIDDVVAFDFKV